ncbi:cell wall-binding repeat / Mac 1 multi-domain protein [Lachnoanaerobaculum saburreum F0468]|uniref:Cell wall-binding repeat / Mac 1 multi-domain protein n=2 Tax=Lachnoanaerobaculum saburreum TaxID=467210 RepID=I0R6N7_9FIRM|nr:cell wall-binding repeat / Mac 1 multi-domain protein [Lachnoanaerobaculum saburreum F0468]
MSILFSFNAYAGIEGWKLENNNWKYYKENKTLKAWQKINDNWYFFNEDGSLKTGWLQDVSGNRYFLDSSKNGNEGVLLSGWQWIDGYCYYFEGSNKDTFGRMYENTVTGGYKIDPAGRWIDENGALHYEKGKGISTFAGSITNTSKNTSNRSTGGNSGSVGGFRGGSSRGGSSKRGGSSGSGSSRSGGSGSGSSRSISLGTDLNRGENLGENSNIGNNDEINREQRTESQGVTAAQNPSSNIAGSLNENIRTENEGTTDNKISDSGKVMPNNSQNRLDNAGNKALNRDGNIADETGKSATKENYNKVTKDSDNKIQNNINNNILEQSSNQGGNSNILEQNNSNNAQNQKGNTLEQSQSKNIQDNTGNTSKQSNAGDTPNRSSTKSNNTGNTLEQSNTGNNSEQGNAERGNPGANTEGNLSPSTEENKPSTPDNTKNPTEQKNIQEQPNNTVNEDNAEDKAERIKDTLTTPKNNNVVQYTDEDGEVRTIIWAKGINAPVMGEGGDFHKEITQGGSDTYEIYKAPFSSGDGWYDVNKTRSGGNIDIDKNLCFAAVASNMLHWWFDQNIENVDNYIAKNGDITRANRQLSDLKTSFESQEDSKIFELYKVLYGYNERGFYTDLLVDLFINGYTPKLSGATNIERDDLIPDNNGGFFYDVFKREKLTDRTYGGNYESLSEILKEVLGDGGLVGLSHKVFSRNNHIVTLWGAEYDLNGKLRAVYVSDSDDQDESNVGMKRYEIRNVGGIAKLSTNITDKSAGAAVGYLHILYLGSEQWNNYFR